MRRPLGQRPSGGREASQQPGDVPRRVLEIDQPHELVRRMGSIPRTPADAGAHHRHASTGEQVHRGGSAGQWNDERGLAVDLVGHLSGEPHEVMFVGPNGTVVEPGYLAGTVLLWTRGKVTYRLEGNLSLASALELARSVS